MPIDSAALESDVATTIRAGDALMIKGSLGSKMKLIVEALQRRFPAPWRSSTTWPSEAIRCFFGWSTFPHPFPASTSFATSPPEPAERWRPPRCSSSCSARGSSIICACVRARDSRSARTDRKSHLIAKKGTPTMGGLMILSGLVVSTLLWGNLRNPYVWIVLAVTLGFGFVGFYDDYLKVTKQTHAGFSGRHASRRSRRSSPAPHVLRSSGSAGRRWRPRLRCRSSRTSPQLRLVLPRSSQRSSSSAPATR